MFAQMPKWGRHLTTWFTTSADFSLPCALFSCVYLCKWVGKTIHKHFCLCLKKQLNNLQSYEMDLIKMAETWPCSNPKQYQLLLALELSAVTLPSDTDDLSSLRLREQVIMQKVQQSRKKCKRIYKILNMSHWGAFHALYCKA